MGKMKAKVLYDYVARSPDELTIKQGDTIRNVSSTDMDGWLSGTLEGQAGIFPGNFVEILEEPVAYPPPPLPSSSPPSSSSSSTQLRTESRFPANHNQLGSVVVPEEEEWWKGTLKGEVEVFAPQVKKLPPIIHGPEKAVMLGRSISEPKLYGRDPTRASKRVAIVKPMSPAEGIIPVHHTTSEDTAAERTRQAQQVSRMDPGRIQSMEEKLRHVFSGANGPTGNFVHSSGNSNLPSNMEREGEGDDNELAETDGVFDLVSSIQMKRGRTVSEVSEVSEVAEMGDGYEHGTFFATRAGTMPTPTPGPHASSNQHQSRVHSHSFREDPIPNKEEFKKANNVRRHSSMSGKTAMMTMIDNMMKGGEQSQVGPTTPNHPYHHQTNASGRDLWPPIAGAELGVGPPSSSPNYANVFIDNPGNISSSMSPSIPTHPPTPPPSHTKPMMPGLGRSTSLYSSSRRMNPTEISSTDQGPPQIPDYPPPPPPIQVQHESEPLASSSSTTEDDDQGRSALLDAIRAQLAKPN